MKRTPGNATADSDPAIASLRLEWAMMAERRDAILSIESCIRGLVKLRPLLSPETVDGLIEEYRSVLRAIVAVRPSALPSVQEMEWCAARMRTLERRLACLMPQAEGVAHARDDLDRTAAHDVPG